MAPTPTQEPTTTATEAPAVAPLSPARRRGRRVALGLYYGLVLAISAASATEITRQVFFVEASPSPFGTCHAGLRSLASAIERARHAAPGTDGEDAAIARFRAALEPDWSYRDGVAASCRASEQDEGALDAIDRLRYAEEHAVRREAGDLAPLRRKVQAIVERDLAPPPGFTAAPQNANAPTAEPAPKPDD